MFIKLISFWFSFLGIKHINPKKLFQFQTIVFFFFYNLLLLSFVVWKQFLFFFSKPKSNRLLFRLRAFFIWVLHKTQHEPTWKLKIWNFRAVSLHNDIGFFFFWELKKVLIFTIETAWGYAWTTNWRHRTEFSVLGIR